MDSIDFISTQEANSILSLIYHVIYVEFKCKEAVNFKNYKANIINKLIFEHNICRDKILKVFDEYEEIFQDMVKDKTTRNKIKEKSVKYDTIKSNIENKECYICLESFSNNSDVYNLCNDKHLFHKTCLDRWIKININCPVCNENITKN